MNKCLIIKILGLCATLFLAGCASMFGDNGRQLTIKSNPSGANIFIDGVNYGQTPAVINLPNYIWDGEQIVLKKSGYNDTAIRINSQFQLVGLWNLLFFPGFIIDAATGDTVKLNQSQLNNDITLSANKS